MADVRRHVCTPVWVRARVPFRRFWIQWGSVTCQTLAVCSSNTFALRARQMYVHVSTNAHAHKWNWHTITCLFNRKGWFLVALWKWKPRKLMCHGCGRVDHTCSMHFHIYINIYPTHVLFCTLFVWRAMPFTPFCIDLTLLFLLLETVVW